MAAGAGCWCIRPARSHEIPLLAELWHRGWTDAHADVLPDALRAFRTPDSFLHRLGKLLPLVRVADAGDGPIGFHVVRGDELYQLYLSAARRGSGAAARLIEDAEQTLRANGAQHAWLACAIGNERAARFYEKCGWQRSGGIVQETEIENGTFPIEVWRYEKDLG